MCDRALEKPRRPPAVWAMDVSKQGVSASSCHMSNLLFAVIASNGRSSASQCSWYFIQYNVDNIIGVSMTILVHRIFISLARLASKQQEVWTVHLDIILGLYQRMGSSIHGYNIEH